MTEDDSPGALPAEATSPNLCPLNLVRGGFRDRMDGPRARTTEISAADWG